VASALAALRRLGELHPPADADRIAGELEDAWAREPFVAGLVGDLVARTALVNFVCGRTTFDAGQREHGASLRIARGDETKFRAVRDDGSSEEHALPIEVDGEEAAGRRDRVASARSVVAERELALDRVAQTLPRALRSRPRWWEIWLWPVRWILGRFRRRALTELQFSSVAAQEATRALVSAEQELEAAEGRVRVVRARFYESLRAVSTGSAVRGVDLWLANGPLPEGVELIEGKVGSGSECDAMLFVEGERLYLGNAEMQHPSKLGTLAESIPTLPRVLATERARGIAEQARAVLAEVVAGADEILDRAEAGFEARIRRLEDMRLHNAAAFQTTELEKIRGQVVSSVHAVIEHTSMHLGSEMQRLAQEWIGAIAGAASPEQLKATVGALEVSSPQVTKRIAEEVRMLAVGGAGGVAHDLYPELVAGLTARGLVEPRPKAAPELPAIDVLSAFAQSSAAKLGGALQWLTGLFRSFDSRRADVREKAHARIEHLREVATAELLETEPRIHAVVMAVLATQIANAVARQASWLERALAAEHELVARERAVLAPLANVRAVARQDLERLDQQIAAIDAHVASTRPGTEMPELVT
jgi:hypothetical protein